MTSAAGSGAPVSLLGHRLAPQIAVFAVIGVASTALHLAGFAALRLVAEPQLANATALLAAAVANTWANRRFTFGIRGRRGAARHQVQGLVVLAVTLATTSGGLALLDAVAPGAPTVVETAVVAVTTAAATAVKFAAMRWWVFRADVGTGPAAGGAVGCAPTAATTNEPTASSNRTAPVQSSPTEPAQTTVDVVTGVGSARSTASDT